MTMRLRSDIPASDIWLALRKVISSPNFRHSPKLQRFLCFLVEETLRGRAQQLREYVLGIEVFGRPASFDSRLDSLVRVEAHRLRAALNNYYKQDGQNDSLRIGMSPGSYIPCFTYHAAPKDDEVVAKDNASQHDPQTHSSAPKKENAPNSKRARGP